MDVKAANTNDTVDTGDGADMGGGARTLSGVVTPILTPFNDDLNVAYDLYAHHAAWLLEEGCHYISPFGTTGEALSLSTASRMAAVDALIDSGIPADRLMPGTGLCNFEETVMLNRHAIDRGCKAVMVLPPFFYKNASEDGIYRYFSEVIERTASDRLKIILYHIPPMTVLGISPKLAARLNRAFSETVVAYKDSSGDFENTEQVLEQAPALSVFPGSELFMRRGMAIGGAGCISATCNVNARAIRQVYDRARKAEAANGGDGGGEDLAKADAEMIAFRKSIQAAGLIPAMKGLLALCDGDRRWANVRPPLTPMKGDEAAVLADQLGDALAPLRRR